MASIISLKESKEKRLRLVIDQQRMKLGRMPEYKLRQKMNMSTTAWNNRMSDFDNWSVGQLEKLFRNCQFSKEQRQQVLEMIGE